MAVSAKVYSSMPLNAIKGLITDLNAAGTTVKVMLTTSTYTPDQETHTSKADVTNEVTGEGYAAGGAALASKAVAEATRVTKFDALDTEWAASTITARRAVIYDATPAADADKKLLCWVDFGEDKSSVAGSFKITWAAGGILNITVAA